MSGEAPNSALKPPAGWREVPLVSVAEPRFSSVDKLTHSSEEPVHLCNYRDAYSNDYITDDLKFMRASATQPEISRFGLQVGDVIITKDSETPDDIGIPAVVDYAASNLVCGYHLALIRPNKDEVDPTFLAKQLRHDRLARYFGQQANGLTRYGLPIGAVNNAPLWLPEPQEQKDVGVILRLMDEAIAKTGLVIAKLRQMRAGLLHDLLTRGLDHNGELRDPIAHPEQFQDSPLGRIPKEWNIKRLDELADVDRGKFAHRPRNEPRFYDGPHPFVQTGDIANAAGEVLTIFSQTLNDEGAAISRQFPANTIAITIAANIADTAILGRPMFLTDSVVGAVVIPPNSVRYVELCIRRAKPQLEARAPQTAQMNINLQDLRPLKVPVPSNPDEQLLISEVYELQTETLHNELVSLEKLKHLKSGLMTDLLTGRVRVPETASNLGKEE